MDRVYRLAQNGETFFASRARRRTQASETSRRRPVRRLRSRWSVAGGLGASKVLAPVIPRKMVCVGLNYKDHAAELGRNCRPNRWCSSSQLRASSARATRSGSRRASAASTHEAELAMVIGKRAHRVKAAHALGLRLRHHLPERCHGARYAKQRTAAHAVQELRHIRTDRPAASPRTSTGRRAWSKGSSNGERRQSSSTSVLIFPVEFLIEYITFVMTLEPGDIISTGTPPGVGPAQGTATSFDGEGRGRGRTEQPSGGRVI